MQPTQIDQILEQVGFDYIPSIIGGIKQKVTYMKYVSTEYNAAKRHSEDTYSEIEIEVLEIDTETKYQQVSGKWLPKILTYYLVKNESIATLGDLAERDRIKVGSKVLRIVRIEPILVKFSMITVEG